MEILFDKFEMMIKFKKKSRMKYVSIACLKSEPDFNLINKFEKIIKCLKNE